MIYSGHDEPPAYVVEQLGSMPTYVCEYPPNKFGLMFCGDGLDRFTINVRLLRMQYIQGAGYVTQDKEAYGILSKGTPFIEIGRCSPL
jgi:hypothetical protein